ncbi:hypothetical protein HanRHA438_Chr09g0394451 [Helianthus annuus]|nr:hypothetical protein HanHA300_Chr09g0314201 [Helianthus annuus]KAJ0542008.1 hypothetical protein HanHA89_Chr09g0335061 [Helianthus annuus]KAJ0707073.1 hypothetical protein HanLR1_Chr09g0314411 [Helianthus annuus]KAJ0711095.1 hypothetical protein HanOQP8_Chr09g0320001 [Helianthus annuus]KAJ0887751.1 hypothetical protein HanRHA438_Chr09g0394451 [Helianthus annuus]
MKRFSSTVFGTKVFPGLLKLVVKAVAVFVSLKGGRVGIAGLEELLLAVVYSKMAVVVVLSKGAPCALA